MSRTGRGADVVVVGAGIIGLASARELARRGADVLVLDRVGPAAGTSSRGEGNMLVSDKEIPAEARLAVRSLELWAEFAASSPVDFEYERKGGVITAWSDAQLGLLAAQTARQQEWGIHGSVIDGDAVRELEPGLSADVAGGVHHAQDAQVMPIHAVRALAVDARRLGVSLRSGVEVQGWEEGAGTVRRLRTSAGVVEADAVVLAAGPWSGALADRLGGRAAVFPRRGLLLVTEPLPPGTVRHKVYDGRYVEAVASDDAAAQVAPVVESTQAGTILIGSTREAVGWDAAVPWELAGRLARHAVELFPGLAAASVIRTYQGFRPATPDHLPLIGPDPLQEGLVHHSGHEGAGIGLALASAELLADAVLEGRVAPAFDPRRFAGGGAADGPVGDVPAADAPGVPGSAAQEGPGTRAQDRQPTVVPGSAAEEQPGTRAPEGATASAAAAWLEAGHQAWRRTRRDDAPRGLFCGIGHCHDCLVPAADGRTVRACLTPSDALAPSAGPAPARGAVG